MNRIQAPSPNHDVRALPVSLLVLHYTGMQSGEAALQRLQDPAAKVSAHYLVEEDGRVFALVDEARRAWHAGLSCWRGITDINSAAVGIEIVNGGHDFGLPGFPGGQIEALIVLCRDILARHSIAPGDVVGHSDIAPARKMDPGERFPWPQLAAAGIGLWPKTTAEAPDGTDWREDLSSIGYSLEDEPAVLRAFQRRYFPDAISGTPCARTRVAAHALAQMLAHS